MIALFLVWLVLIIDFVREGKAMDAGGAAAGIGCPSVLLLIVVTSLLQGLAHWRMRARLAERCAYLPGRVLRATAKSQKGRWYVSIHYAFKAPDGRPIEGSWGTERRDLEGQPPPEPGTPVLVAFRDERTFVLM